MHYTLQFPLDCITGVSEGERKKSERRVMECPPATSTNRRKLKFHNMPKPVSSNPLLPFLLAHFSVTRPVQISLEKCLVQRNNSVTIPGPNETADRLDQGPTVNCQDTSFQNQVSYLT